MDRKTMEKTFGELGSGAKQIVIRGAAWPLRRVLAQWTLDLPDIMTVDGGTLAEDRHWIRFYDRDDRFYVVFVFDGSFDILEEHRADSLAWEGDEFFRSRVA